MEPINWYYAKGGNRHGPVSSEKLQQLAASGQIQPTDLVWKDGMAAWQSARSIDGLFSGPTIQPPPPAQHTESPPANSFLLLLLLSLIFCFPLGLVLVWLRPGWETRRKRKWTGVTLACVVGFYVLMFIIGTAGKSASKTKIAQADRLWTEGQREQAVILYKDARIFAPDADKPRVYGRILDFEAPHGSPAVLQQFLKETQEQRITPSCSTEAARSLVARSEAAPTGRLQEVKPLETVDSKQKDEYLRDGLWVWQSEPDPSVATDALDFESVEYDKGPQGQPVETRTEKQPGKAIVLHGYTGKDGRWYLHGEQHEMCTGSYVPTRGAYGQVGHYVYGRKHGLFFEDLILHASPSAPSDKVNTIVWEFYYYNDDLRKHVDYVNRREGRKFQEVHSLNGKRHGPSRMFDIDSGQPNIETVWEHGVLKE